MTTQIGNASSAQGFWHPHSREHASGTIPPRSGNPAVNFIPHNQSFTLLQNESNTFVNNPLCDISLGSTSFGTPVELWNWRLCDSCVCVLGLFAVHLPPAFSPKTKMRAGPTSRRIPVPEYHEHVVVAMLIFYYFLLLPILCLYKSNL